MPDFDEPQFVKLAGGMGNLCVCEIIQKSLFFGRYRNKGLLGRYRFFVGLTASFVHDILGCVLFSAE